MNFKKVNTQYNKKSITSMAKNIFSGSMVSTEMRDYWDNGTINMISSDNIYNGVLNSSYNKINQHGLIASSNRLCSHHSTLVSISGNDDTKGMVGFTETEMTYDHTIAAIEFNGDVWPYLAYKQLSFIHKEIKNLADGNGVISINSIGGLLINDIPEKESYNINRFINEQQRKIRTIKKLIIELHHKKENQTSVSYYCDVIKSIDEYTKDNTKVFQSISNNGLIDIENTKIRLQEEEEHLDLMTIELLSGNYELDWSQ
jgi:hypothetical protein